MTAPLRVQESGFLGTGSVQSFVVFEPERKLKFVALLSEFWPDVSKCCAAVGIHRTTFDNHLKWDVKFCKAVEAIKAAKLDELERVAIESGRDQRKGFLDRAMILRAHRPELYDRAKVVKIEGYKMAAGEREQRAAALDQAIDVEVSKVYLDRKQRREAKRQSQVKALTSSGGKAAGAGT